MAERPIGRWEGNIHVFAEIILTSSTTVYGNMYSFESRFVSADNLSIGRTWWQVEGTTRATAPEVVLVVVTETSPQISTPSFPVGFTTSLPVITPQFLAAKEIQSPPPMLPFRVGCRISPVALVVKLGVEGGILHLTNIVPSVVVH